MAVSPKKPTSRVAAKAWATALLGVPILSEYMFDPRNSSARGVIMGYGGGFNKKQLVTTSAIVGDALSANTVVQTELGWR